MIVPTPTAELERIWLLLQLGRHGQAEEAARRLLAANPVSWRAHYLRSVALRFLDRLDEARTAATAAVGLSPESAIVHHELAQVYGQQGRFEPAHESAIEALRLDPARADSHGYRAQLFYLRGKFRAAIGCAEDGLRFNPRHTDCLLWRALAQEAQDQRESANADFARLLHLAPESAQLHRRLGQVLLRRHEPMQADEHLSTALRMQPEQADTLVPLVRKARLQGTWPPWLLHMAGHQAHERTLGLEGGLQAAFVYVASGLFALRARWLTRHDPLFALTRAQRWRLWQGLWVSLIIIVPVLILAGDHLKLFDAGKPLTIPQMLALLAAGGLFQWVIHLMGKKANS